MINLLIITHEAVGEAYRSLTHHFFPTGMPETSAFSAWSLTKTKTTSSTTPSPRCKSFLKTTVY